MIRQLPREAATVQAIRGHEVAWSDSDHMLAMAVDLLAGANWQRGNDPKSPSPQPDRLPRPGEAETKKRQADEMAARLLAQRQRTGGG